MIRSNYMSCIRLLRTLNTKYIFTRISKYFVRRAQITYFTGMHIHDAHPIAMYALTKSMHISKPVNKYIFKWSVCWETSCFMRYTYTYITNNRIQQCSISLIPQVISAKGTSSFHMSQNQVVTNCSWFTVPWTGTAVCVQTSCDCMDYIRVVFTRDAHHVTYYPSLRWWINDVSSFVCYPSVRRTVTSCRKNAC